MHNLKPNTRRKAPSPMAFMRRPDSKETLSTLCCPILQATWTSTAHTPSQPGLPDPPGSLQTLPFAAYLQRCTRHALIHACMLDSFNRSACSI